MEFPCDDDEDEVTSPFQHSRLYTEGWTLSFLYVIYLNIIENNNIKRLI